MFINQYNRKTFQKNYKWSKYLQVLFVLYHILLAADFGYVRRPTRKIQKAISYITMLYCIIVSLTSIYFFYVISDDVFLFWWLFGNVLLYFLNALILVLHEHKHSFYKLQKSMMLIDFKLYVDSRSYGIEKKIIIGSMFALTSKLGFNYLFCVNDVDNNECMNTLWGIVVHVMQQMSADMVMIVSSFIFYSVYCRLRVLNVLVKNGGKEVMEYLWIYKSMANALERATNHFNILYMLGLVFKMPDMLISTFLSLWKLKVTYEYDGAHHHILRNLYIVYTFVVTSCPAVTAGLVSAAVEDLRLIIHERLQQEKDTFHEADLELFLSYVDGRPMRFTVFKLLPLDWSLPVFIINYMIGLIFITTDQIYTAYLGLLKFKYDGEGHTPQMILRNLYSLQNFALLSSPAISAGLVTVVVGDLKLILLERILQERDKDHEVHLQTFLDYVNVRPMQFKVFSVAPLDWSLPILILNLCISYQIIIVQFTKLY